MRPKTGCKFAIFFLSTSRLSSLANGGVHVRFAHATKTSEPEVANLGLAIDYNLAATFK